MNNAAIVQLLHNVAAALSIKEANRFRIVAYEKAADSIEHLTSEVKDVWEEGQLENIPGVGPTIAGYLKELFKTGKVKHFETVFKGISPAVFEFLLIPGIGPKKAFRLTKEFKLNNPKTAITELEEIARSGKIASLDGFGEKSQSEILSGIEVYKKGQIKENRMLLPYADELAQEVMSYLKKHPAVKRVDELGSLRRKVTTIGDVDLSVATTKSIEVIKYFTQYPKMRKIIDQGEKGATILLSIGRQVDLRVQYPETYGAMLQYFTGSKHHNIKLREYALKKGLSLSEHGIKNLKTGKTEEFNTETAFYKALGMPWIPPEIREDAGEIQAALAHKLPVLVELSDIRGDLHIHSNYDIKSSHDTGESSLAQLLTHAQALNYAYIGISDHNPSIGNHYEQQISSLMKTRLEKLQQDHRVWKQRSKANAVELFVMLEVDILPNGNLALPQEAFKYVDAVIVSLHSSLRMEKAKMTERILKALSYPKVKILGHPTGRLLPEREGCDADWPAIFRYAKSHSQALEINAWPQRLDLTDLLVREALQIGVQFVINTDSHAANHLKNMQYGVDVAQRGWAEKKDILNTMEYNKCKDWILG
jgi:DNA polymerase (family 10)